jgi:hypothetical protein
VNRKLSFLLTAAASAIACGKGRPADAPDAGPSLTVVVSNVPAGATHGFVRVAQDGGTDLRFFDGGAPESLSFSVGAGPVVVHAEALDPGEAVVGAAFTDPFTPDGGPLALALLPFGSAGGFLQPCAPLGDGGCACSSPDLFEAHGFCTRFCGSGCAYGACWSYSNECYGELVPGSACSATGPIVGRSPFECFVYCHADGGGCPPQLHCDLDAGRVLCEP